MITLDQGPRVWSDGCTTQRPTPESGPDGAHQVSQ